MFKQFEDMAVVALVEKLNGHGLNIDADTVKKAIANSPQLVTQIESILLASTTQDRLAKISALISQAASGQTTTGQTTASTTTTQTGEKT